jgi:hypothetical protein
LSAGEDDDGKPFVAVAHEALLRNWPRLGAEGGCTMLNGSS